MVSFGIMLLGQTCSFDFDNDHETKTKNHVRDVADGVIEVTEDPKRFLALEIVITNVLRTCCFFIFFSQKDELN